MDKIIKENDSDNSLKRWSNKEIEILKLYFPHKSKYEMKILLPARSMESIQTQAQRLGIQKTYERKLESNLENIDLVNNFKYREQGFDNISEYVDYIKSQKPHEEINLNKSFNQYKELLQGNRTQFGNNVVNKYNLIILFKYYLRLNNIEDSKESLLSLNYSDVCEKSKLDSFIQKHYEGYYDFICTCYSRHCFKRWEFKILDCPNNYWNNKYNMFYCIRECISNMFEQNIISNYSELFQIPHNILIEYFHSSVNYFRNGLKYNIIDYLNFIKANYNINKLYNGILFDSIEEIYVYKQLKKYNESIIKNTKLRFRNEKYNENYIPDFIIENNIIVEYFGMYKPNNKSKVYEHYVDKTLRKIEFFNNLKGFIFMPIFPNEIYKNQIHSKLNMTLKGGDINGRKSSFI